MALAGETLGGLGGGGEDDAVSGKRAGELLEKAGGGEEFADADGVEPDGGLGVGGAEFGGDVAEAGAETCTIARAAQHAEQEEGRAGEESGGQKKAVQRHRVQVAEAEALRHA